MQQQQESVPDYAPITIQSDIAYLSSFLAAKPPVELACTQTPINNTTTNNIETNASKSSSTPTPTSVRKSNKTIRRIRASDALAAYEREPVAGSSTDSNNDRMEAIRLRRKRERGRMSRVLMNYQRETRERLWVTVPAREVE